MPQKPPAKPNPFGQIVDRAFKDVQSEHGLSARDFFMVALGYSAVGLLLLNLEFVPKGIQPLGWLLLVPGVFVMVLFRKER